MKWSIYILSDPETLEVRYVGYTTQTLYRRLKGHIHHAKAYGRGKVRLWILQMLASEKEPIISLLESGEGAGWIEAERRWIKHYRELLGDRLVNQASGGEGVPGFCFSEESRQRISAKNKGRKNTPEHAAKLHAAAVKANTGRKRTPEHTEKIVSKLRGRPRPPEVWEKCRAAAQARVISIEARQKIREFHTGLKASDETKAKMSKAHLGHRDELVARAKRIPRMNGKWAKKGEAA